MFFSTYLILTLHLHHTLNHILTRFLHIDFCRKIGFSWRNDFLEKRAKKSRVLRFVFYFIRNYEKESIEKMRLTIQTQKIAKAFNFFRELKSWLLPPNKRTAILSFIRISNISGITGCLGYAYTARHRRG